MQCWVSLAGNYQFSLFRLIFRSKSLVCKQSASLSIPPFFSTSLLSVLPCVVSVFKHFLWSRVTQIAQLHNKKGKETKRRECLIRTWLTEKTENKWKLEDVNPYFQLIGEMKGFIVQYIAHGERRPLVLAASTSKDCSLKKSERVCVCVCMLLCVVLRQGADKKIVNTGWRATIRW